MPTALQSERKFKQFLKQYEAKKMKNGGKITHTRIPKYYGSPEDKDPRNIYGGSWIIPDEKIEEFHNLYIDYVFNHGKSEYLTESQKDNGQVLIDLDFHYTLDIQKREDIYLNSDTDDWNEARKDQIMSILEFYLDSLKEMLDINEPFNVYISEKEDVVMVPDKKITKDGIHIVIGINLDRRLQEKLREMVISKIELSISNKEFCIDLPDIINKEKWNDVIDYSIASGNTNWQMLGSKKPENNAYELVYGFTFELDDSNTWSMEEIDELNYDDSKLKYVMDNFNKISAKGDGKNFEVNTGFNLTGVINSLEQSLSKNNNSLTISHINNGPPNFVFPNIDSIKDIETLDSIINNMLMTENMVATEYERLKNTHEYCIILPQEYSDDYNKWKKVGWALKNTDVTHCLQNKLFLTYLKFSSSSDKFSFDDIPSMWNDWLHKSKSGDDCLSEKSIFYWARNSNPTEFEKIKNNSISHFVELSFNSQGSDWDIAAVLHQLYKDRFVVASLSKDLWYEFIGHCWSPSDKGVELSIMISTELYNVYHDKTLEMVQIMSGLENDKDEWKDYQQKVTISSNICNKLKNSTSKRNIMNECRQMFFDKNFYKLVDLNLDLLSCSNGVINLKTGEFRKGCPEDYITKCTDIDYIYPHQRDKQIENEIKEFWEKIFSEPEVGRYVWDIFAGALSGENVTQKFHIFLGAGSNGKSVVMSFMRAIFNDDKKRGYYAQTPIQYLTQERIKAGAASSELSSLIGVRLTSIDEPEKNEKLNVGIMKQLTGGDPLTARAMYQDAISFIPQFTFVALTNNLFEIAATDKGTWRRISVPPFKSTFTQFPYNDPEYPVRDFPTQHLADPNIVSQKFPLWKETGLSMLIERVLETQGKIESCKIVDDEVSKYKKREDFVQQFIDEKICETGDDEVLQQRDLSAEFKQWYDEKFGGKIKRMQDLYDVFNKKYEKHGKSGWRGIDIVSEH